MNQDQDKNVNELNPEKKTEAPGSEPMREESDVPLFLRDSSEGDKSNPQDEKDKTTE